MIKRTVVLCIFNKLNKLAPELSLSSIALHTAPWQSVWPHSEPASFQHSYIHSELRQSSTSWEHRDLWETGVNSLHPLWSKAGLGLRTGPLDQDVARFIPQRHCSVCEGCTAAAHRAAAEMPAGSAWRPLTSLHVCSQWGCGEWGGGRSTESSWGFVLPPTLHIPSPDSPLLFSNKPGFSLPLSCLFV